MTVIQAVDPARHTAAVTGHLPEPLTVAAAVTLDGEVFVVADGGSPTARRPARASARPSCPASPGRSVPPCPRSGPSTPLPGGCCQAWLQVPVSHAVVTVSGSTGWIVGSESGGTVVSAVQMLRPDRAFGTAGAPGAGSPYFGAKLLMADRGTTGCC